jgi:flavin reductase (DIM6/NTAB) family NADH-FMN oxidoreductase RutF
MDSMSSTDLTPTTLREAFGHFPSGVIAIAAEVDGARVGLAASTFVPVSLDPPLVSFCLADSVSAAPAVARATTVAVHVLHHEQEAAARTFATSGIDRFAAHGAWTPGPDGVPLLDGVAARIVCRIDRRVRAGDHTIVLATPIAGDLHGDAAATPLVYHDGAYTHLPAAA